MSQDKVAIQIETTVKDGQEVIKLAADIDKLATESVLAGDKVDEFAKELDDLQKAGEIAADMQRLETSIADTKKSLRDSTGSIQAANAAYAQMQITTDSIIEALKGQELEVKETEKTLSTLEKTLNKQIKSQTEAAQAIEQTKNALDSQGATLRDAQDAYTQLANHADTTSEALEQQGDAVKEAEQAYSTLEKTLSEQEAAFSKANEAIGATEKELRQAQYAVDDAKEAYDELKTAGESSASAMKDQAKQISDIENQQGKLSSTLKKQASEYDAVNARLNNSSDAVKKLVTDSAAYEQATKKAAESSKLLTAELEDMAKVSSARDVLGVKSHELVQQEIEKTKKAYQDLKNSGTLNFHELSQAQMRMKDQVTELKKQTNGWTDSLGKAKTAMLGLAASGAVLTSMAKEAIAFEGSMAEVSKVLDGTEEQISGLSGSLLKMSERIPLSAQGLADIAAAGAQLGVQIGDIEQYVETVAKMSTAWDMAPDAAGKAVASLQNIFSIGLDEVSSLGDAINFLSNNTAASAEEIINTLTRIGGAAKQFGLAEEQAAALAASLISVGKDSSTAGTAINAFLNRLQTASSQGADFQNALASMGYSAVKLGQEIKENPQQAIENLLGAMKKLDSAERAGVLTKMFGREHQASVAILVESSEKLSEAFGLIGERAAYAGSVTEEFNKRTANTDMQLQLFKNSVNRAAIELGTAFLPAVNAVANSLADAASAVGDFASENPNITAMASVVALCAVNAKALSAGFIAIKTALAGLGLGPAIKQFDGMNTSIKGATTSATALRAAMAGLALYESAFAGWKIGTYLREEFEVAEKAGIALAAGLHKAFEYMRFAWESFKAIFTDDTVYDALTRHLQRIKEIDEGYMDLFATVESQEERSRRKMEESGEAAKQFADKLKDVRDKYGEVGVAAVTTGEKTKEEMAAHLGSVERVGESLKELGLSYRELTSGITDNGAKALKAFENLHFEVAATSDLLRNGFVAALNQIKTPEELMRLTGELQTMADAGKLSAEDLARLSPTLDLVKESIEKGLPAGTAFTDLLKQIQSTAADASLSISGLLAQQEKQRQEMEQTAKAALALSSAQMDGLRAELEIAKAQGDSNAVRSITIEIMEAEAAYLEELARYKEEALEQEKKQIAAIQARIDAGAVLTEQQQQELEQRKSAISLAELEITTTEKQAEAKRRAAEATAQATEKTKEAGAASEKAADASEKLGKSVEDTGKRVTSSGNSWNIYTHALKGSGLAHDALTDKMKDHLDMLVKNNDMLSKNKTTSAYMEYAKVVQKMAKSYADLVDEIKNTEAPTAKMISQWEQAAEAFRANGDIKMDALVAELNRVKQAAQEVRDEAKDMLDSIQDEIDEMQGNQAAILERQNAAKILDIEAKIAEAKAKGNKEAEEYYKIALQKQKELYKMKQDELKLQEQQTSEGKKNSSSSSSSSKSSSGAGISSRVAVDLNIGGTTSTLYADDEEMAQRFLNVLKDKQRTSRSAL